MLLFNRLFKTYARVPHSILNLVTGIFLLDLVNSGFMLILNIYLKKIGYDDVHIASYTAYRFLGVLLLAFPLGIYIKGKPLKPYFIASALIVPFSSLVMLYAVDAHFELLTKVSFFIWGIGFMLLQVCALPYIMRTAPEDALTESITLNFSMWSLSTVIAGIFIAVLTKWGSLVTNISWTEREILIFIACVGLLATLLMLRLEESTPRSPSITLRNHFKDLATGYDWRPILKVITPTLLIAVGAGLTIPFVNLFFFSVFGMSSTQFSLIGSITAVILFFTALLVPYLRRRFGFKVTIIVSQGFAILFLVIMSMTEVYATLPGMLAIAVAFYMFRQPLMNMAGPITSELSMKYVGKRNQELISALDSSIWSASWFVSAKIFQFLRSVELPYYKIFLITAVLYSCGVLFYYRIIKEYEKRGGDESISA